MRRRAVKRVPLLLTAVVGLLLPLLAGLAPAHAEDPGPKPRTPIQHFVFLFQANHSFDNYFGTRPGVDGIPAGVCMPRVPGTAEPCVKPFHIPTGTPAVLGHARHAFELQYDNGAMDGFVWANADRGSDGSIAMGHYDDRNLPYYWNLADQYVLFDRFFTSSRTGSISNHMFAVAAAPGVVGNREKVPARGWGDLPTIFDRLTAAGIDWKFYIQNYDPDITFRTHETKAHADRAAQVVRAPVLGFARYIDNPRIASHIVDLSQYYKDASEGTLPAVSYIVPSGPSEHPPGSLQAGQRFVRSLVSELMRSRQWSSSAFLWSYDDSGGWYDHVPPPEGMGFRVPALLVSPYARKGHVASETSEFSSIPAFIEHNWGLRPLTARDRDANDLMSAFNFSAPPRKAVLVGMTRAVDAPPRPFTPPVYAAYALALAVVTGLALFARRRTGTRGPAPTQGVSP